MWLIQIHTNLQAKVLGLFFSYRFILFERWSFRETEGEEGKERGRKGKRKEERKRSRETQRSPVHWFTPRMVVRARAELF